MIMYSSNCQINKCFPLHLQTQFAVATLKACMQTKANTKLTHRPTETAIALVKTN